MTDEIKRIVQWLRIMGETKDGDVIDAPVTQSVMGENWVQAEDIVIPAADLLEKLACERDQWKARCEAAERDIEQMLINHDEAFDRIAIPYAHENTVNVVQMTMQFVMDARIVPNGAGRAREMGAANDQPRIIRDPRQMPGLFRRFTQTGG